MEVIDFFFMNFSVNRDGKNIRVNRNSGRTNKTIKGSR